MRTLRLSGNVVLGLCAGAWVALAGTGCGGSAKKHTIDVTNLVRVQQVNRRVPFSAPQLEAAMLRNLQADAPDGVAFVSRAIGGGRSTTAPSSGTQAGPKAGEAKKPGGGGPANLAPAGQAPNNPVPPQPQSPPQPPNPEPVGPAPRKRPPNNPMPPQPQSPPQPQYPQGHFSIIKGAKGYRWFYIDPSGRAVATDPEGFVGGYYSEQAARAGLRHNIALVFDNATLTYHWQLRTNYGQVTYTSPPFKGSSKDAEILKSTLPVVREPGGDNANSEATLVRQVPPSYNDLSKDDQTAVRDALDKAAQRAGGSNACPSGGQLTPECAKAAADALVQQSVEDLASASGRSVSDITRGAGGPLASVAVANAFLDATVSRNGQVESKVVAMTSPAQQQGTGQTPSNANQTTTPERPTTTPERQSTGQTATQGEPSSGATSQGGQKSGEIPDGGAAPEGGAAPQGGSGSEATP